MDDEICLVNPYYFVPLHVVLCITSLLGNTLILVALQKESSLHPASKLLFRCLSCTDLLVGLTSQPLFIIYLIVFAKKNLDICRITETLAFISSAILCGESIYTSTAISVDRLLALLLKLRYRQMVTLRGVCFFVIFSWTIRFVLPMTYLWETRVFFIGCGVCIGICLSISSCCYFKIYFTIRHQQAQVQNCQPRPGTSLNMAWYKKTVSSALWIHFTLILSYLPHAIATVVTILRGLSCFTAIAWNITGFMIFLNSTLNPFLYCWKIKEVRQAVKDTLMQLFR